jgi:hypothetical protein
LQFTLLALLMVVMLGERELAAAAEPPPRDIEVKQALHVNLRILCVA